MAQPVLTAAEPVAPVVSAYIPATLPAVLSVSTIGRLVDGSATG